METELFDLFLHAEGRSKAIQGAPGEKLRDVLIRFEFIEETEGKTLVFVGECEEALTEPDDAMDGADEHAPIDIDLTLEVLELHRHKHVHCHTCRHVTVKAHYGKDEITRRFSPATTVETVTRWARRKFRLDAAAAANYVLQICDSKKQPGTHLHLSQLVERSTCAICFDLVDEVTPKG
jgi:hypothetical protein